ncbi:MAG: hypothetical protein PHE93_05085 [Clostridia bacterium]|nr:hypothetical protein [Clostridia bacterium]
MDRFCFVLSDSDNRMRCLKSELEKLHAPSGRPCYVFSPNVLLDFEMVSELSDYAVLFYGRATDEAISLFESKELTTFCLLKDEEFAAKNAILTAEATLSILIDRSPLALSELNVLIVGFGRIGAALASLLCRLGVRTTIATSASSRPARAFCEHVIPISELDFSQYNAIVNTAPVCIANDQQVLSLKPQTLFIDVASKPSINLAFANYLGIDAAIYPALPTKFSPLSAAKIIKDFIVENLEMISKADDTDETKLQN